MNNNASTSFMKFLTTPKDGVKPYSILAVVGITVVLGLVDIVGGVVLIIAAFVFMLKGHKGLSLLLTAVNLVVPDALPFVDEAVNIVVVALPLYMQWQKTKDLGQSVEKAIDSKKQFENTK